MAHVEELVHGAGDQGPGDGAHECIGPAHGRGEPGRQIRFRHEQSTQEEARNERENPDEPNRPPFDQRGEIVVVRLLHERRLLPSQPRLRRHRAFAQHVAGLVEPDAFVEKALSLACTVRASADSLPDERKPTFVRRCLDAREADGRRGGDADQGDQDRQ